MPHSAETEAAILGAMLADNATIPLVRASVKRRHFYLGRHAHVFGAMCRIADRGDVVEAVAIADELGHRLAELGGMQMLARLIDAVPGTQGLEGHMRRLVDFHMRREVVRVACDITLRASTDTEGDAVVDDAVAELMELRRKAMRRGYSSAHDIVPLVLDDIQRAQDDPGALRGLSTGLAGLDNAIGGLRAGELVVIAGRPGSGKSSLATQVAGRNVLDGSGVYFSSLEMGEREVVGRMLCADARLTYAQAVRGSPMTDAQYTRLADAAGRLADAPLFVDPSATITPNELRAKAQRAVERDGVRLVVVDYIQLMSTGVDHSTREREVASITRALKVLAKELAVPVIALSQMSRAVEARSGHRPVLADLRESGAIEQDADVVVFVFRPGMYDEMKAPLEAAELIVAKSRNGPTGTIHARFRGAFMDFEETQRRPMAVNS